MTQSPRVVIAGGGSLGSIYPGLAIARRLRELAPDARVTIAGDGRAIERHTVRAAGLAYVGVPRRDRPTSVIQTPQFVVSSAAGWCVSNWLLREAEADLVISIGGHASGPLARAALACGAPLLLVESNALPYPATSRLADRAHAVCLAFEETAARVPTRASIRLTGGVARPGFEEAFAQSPGSRPPIASDSGRPRLVVLGGVAGATSLNRAVPRAVSKLADRMAGWKIVHQTGAGWLHQTEQSYRECGVDAVVVSYVDELAHLAQAADLIVCRPGGSALAEIAMAGLPALLVPDTRRRDEVHVANARIAADRYGCPVVADDGPDFAERLAAVLDSLASDSATRESIAARLVRDASPNAAEQVARVACQTLGLAWRPQQRHAA